MRRRESELDRDIAALLAARAFIEIRHLAGSTLHESGDSPEETLVRIRFLANLAHNLPGVARPRPATPSRLGAGPGSREQAMAARPMTGSGTPPARRGRRGSCATSNKRDEPGHRPRPCRRAARARHR